MRRFLIYLSVLCIAAALAVLGTRLSQAEHAAHAQYEARFAAAGEALEQLSLSLDEVPLLSSGPLQADVLLRIARSGNTVRTHLAALPLDPETAAAVTAALNDVTGRADALLCTLAVGDMPDAADVSALAQQQALCRRLCTQLLLAQGNGSGGYAAMDASAQRLLAQLNAAVCCEGNAALPAPMHQQPAPKGLTGDIISQADALALAAAYVPDAVISTAPAPDTGGMLPAYGVTAVTGDLRLNLEITRQGGKLLMMTPETASFPQLCSRDTARLAASDYLAQHGFGSMEEVAWQWYDGLYMAVMAPVQDQVLLYPDVVHVQVRADTAQVVGFEASAYWTSHVQRSLPQPALQVHEVLAQLPEALPHSGAALCLLPLNGAEVLCYQVHVRQGDDDYLLFCSAADGQQLAVQKLVCTADGVYPA